MQAQPQSVWSYISRESSDVLDRFLPQSRTAVQTFPSTAHALCLNDSVMFATILMLQENDSLRGQATIHIQYLPRNPLRIIASKIHRSPCMIGGVPKAAARNGGLDGVRCGGQGPTKRIIKHGGLRN